jgi:hypothetical protein
MKSLTKTAGNPGKLPFLNIFFNFYLLAFLCVETEEFISCVWYHTRYTTFKAFEYIKYIMYYRLYTLLYNINIIKRSFFYAFKKKKRGNEETESLMWASSLSPKFHTYLPITWWWRAISACLSSLALLGLHQTAVAFRLVNRGLLPMSHHPRECINSIHRETIQWWVCHCDS